MTDEPEAEAAQTRIPNQWQAPPFALAIIVIVLMTDLLAILSEDYEPKLLAVGLAFGQAGALSAWAFAAGIRRRLLMSVISLIVGAILSIALTLSLRGLPRFRVEEFAVMVLLLIEYQLVILFALFLLKWIRPGFKSKSWKPQFSVRHLLAIMILTSLLATLIQLALPQVDKLLGDDIIVAIMCWATIAIAGGLLLLDHPPVLWRLGVFAGIGLCMTYICTRYTQWNNSAIITIVLMTTLAICMVVPQFDRYTMRVTFEPRDQPEASAETADELTE